MLLHSVGRVLRIVDISEQQVGKVEQSGARSGQRPGSLLIVELAEEAELAPVLLDLVVGERGRWFFCVLSGAPIHHDGTGEQESGECQWQQASLPTQQGEAAESP